MDAAHKLLSKTALFFATAFLVASQALAQTPIINVSTPSVTLPVTGGGTSVIVGITSSTSDPITFTAAKGSTDGWYTISLNQLTTPASMTVSLASALTLPLTGTITLTNTANSATTTVTVNYVPGGGGSGSGTISASSNFVSFNLASGNSNSQNVTLSTQSQSALQFTAAASAVGGSPLFLSPPTASTFTVSQNNTAILTITANAGTLNAGTYTNNVAVTPTGGATTNIQVQLTVGTGGGGTTGTLTVNSNQLFFSYPSGTTSQTLNVQSTIGAFSFNATANSSGSWLNIGGAIGQTQLSGIPTGFNALTIFANSNVVNTFAAGTYFGTVVLANPSNPQGDTTTVNVQLTVSGGNLLNLTSSKTSVQFNAPGGSSAALQDSIFFSAQNGISTSYSIAGTTGTWLFVQPNATFLPGSITLTASPAGLPAGTYQGSVSVNFSGGVQGQQTFPVTLVVGSGGGIITGGVAPTSLSFAFQTGVNDLVPPQTVTVGGTGPISVAVSTLNGQTWLNATGSGQAPGTVTVSVIPNLPQGTYSGTVTITTSTGTSQVGVTLLVSSSPVISADPVGSINATFQSTSTPFITTVTITSSDNSSLPVQVASGASWVTFTAPTGSSTTPTSFIVTVNPAGLPNGINSTTLTVTAPGAANTPLTIPIVALVTGSSGGGTGVLTLSSSALTFSGAVNGTQPPSQTLFVSAATQTGFQINTSGASWLSLSPLPGSNLVTNQSITVTANTTGLAAATYTASILLTASGITQTVPVTLTVGGGSGGTGNVTVSPTSLAFSSNAGSNPGVKGLTITTSGSTNVAAIINATTQSGGSWLSAGITNGGSITTPTTLNVSVNVTGLAPGTYNGTITVAPNGGSQISVPVTLSVTTNTVTATTSSGGTSLTFNYRVSDSAPATQQISVNGAGTFTATASSTGNWLSASPNTGSAPNTVNVNVNPSGLTAGTYNGTVVVAGSGGTTGSTTINVQFVVTAPLPSVTRVTNAASFLSGAISPGEIITLFGTNIGPSPGAGLTLDSNGRVSTSIGGVQVLINGFLAPMVFASSLQVSAVVPYEIKGQLSANVQVRYQGQTSNSVTVQVAATAPGIFTASAQGTGPAAILYPNPTLATATRGDVIVIYVTGEGETNPSGVTGKVTTVSSVPPITPEPLLRSSLVVLIDGQPAEVLFAGEAPGFVSGALQLNVRIPANARSGDLQLVVSLGGVTSQPGVTVPVR